MNEQLSLVPGAERPADVKPQAPLSRTQREILAKVREQGSITSTAAGVILHARRKHCGTMGQRATDWSPGERSLACCAYAASDGSMACRRLAERGLLVRAFPGWVAA